MNLAASRFERAYTRKVNNFGFLLLLAHLPVLCVLAFIMDVSPWTPVWVMILLLAAPAAIIANNRSSKAAGVILGIAAMGVSALTIYVCHGVIEAHFEIFVLIAMLAVYASGAAFLAWCKFHLAGRWRSIYVLSIAAVLCCNILFVTMQAFPRIPVMASMQSAPVLLLSQLALTVPVILLGMAALRRFHHSQSHPFSQL